MLNRKQQRDQKGCLLFILAGDPRWMPQNVRPKRKRAKVWQLEGEAPENWEPPKKFNRSNPANAGMDEKAAWAKETLLRSHSNKIEEYAKSAKFVHIMRNEVSDFTGAYRESPSHRDMTDDERSGKISPKIGPQHQ